MEIPFLKKSNSRVTDKWTNKPTDEQTTSYWDVRTHLKIHYSKTAWKCSLGMHSKEVDTAKSWMCGEKTCKRLVLANGLKFINCQSWYHKTCLWSRGNPDGDTWTCGYCSKGRFNWRVLNILMGRFALTGKIEFLDAFSHLYKRVCPSVCPSVGPSVRGSHSSSTCCPM